MNVARGSVHRHPRLKALSPWFTIALILCSGCVRVDPKPDYARTGRLVAERTGAGDLYHPDIEPLIEEKTARLLTDGLTIDEAVQVALLNNHEFQSQFQEIGVSRAELVQSGLMSNPSLFTSARFPDGGGRSNLTFSFAQELADLWQIPIRRRIARAKLQRTILTVVRQAINLSAAVKIKCYELLALEQAERIAHENLELLQRSVKLAQDRFDAGEVGQLDVNLTRSNLLDVKLKLLSLRRQRRIAGLAVARVLGLARWEQAWTLQGLLPRRPLHSADTTALVIFAMRQRLDAQAAAMQTRAAEAEVRRQYLRIVPSVTAGVEEERQERRALPGRKILADTGRASVANGRLTAPGIQSRGQRNIERSQIIDSLLGPALSLTLPIWHQNQAKIARARFKAVQARKDYESLLDSVAQGVAQAAASARIASELVTFYEKQSLPLARNNVDAARRAYQAGEQNIIALIDAQRTLITQQRQYVDTQRDYAIAQAELERSLGGRLPPPDAQGSAAPQPVASEEESP